MAVAVETDCFRPGRNLSRRAFEEAHQMKMPPIARRHQLAGSAESSVLTFSFLQVPFLPPSLWLSLLRSSLIDSP